MNNPINIEHAALELLRFKALRKLAGNKFPDYLLGIDDVNEVLTVAGLPVIIPDELKAKELDVISTEKEEEDA